MNRGVIFSESKNYRYALFRNWKPGPIVSVIGLNPSTADHELDDQTIKKTIQFAQQNGFGGFVMLNLFALRSTDPKVMKASNAPIGKMNDFWLQHFTFHTNAIWCAWGAHGSHQGRDEAVKKIVHDSWNRTSHPVDCLGVTKHGHPKHPLMLPYSTLLQPFSCGPRMDG
jgi:hypothetical protein